jgi:hypothetical protein
MRDVVVGEGTVDVVVLLVVLELDRGAAVVTELLLDGAAVEAVEPLGAAVEPVVPAGVEAAVDDS